VQKSAYIAEMSRKVTGATFYVHPIDLQWQVYSDDSVENRPPILLLEALICAEFGVMGRGGGRSLDPKHGKSAPYCLCGLLVNWRGLT